MKELGWYFFTGIMISVFQALYYATMGHLINLIVTAGQPSFFPIILFIPMGFVALLAVAICNGITGHGFKVRLTLPGEK